MAKVKRIDNIDKLKKNTKPKAKILYLFLVFMFISTVISLFKSNYVAFGYKLGGFILLYASIKLIDIGLENEQKYNNSKIIKVSKIPYKLVGSILLGIFIFYLNYINNVGFLNATITSILGFLGSYIYYGKDPSKDKLPQYNLNYERVLKELQEAQEKIDFINSQKDKVLDYQLKEAINKAANRAQEILETIKEDPKDINVARKFMVVYLDGIKDVLDKYNSIEKELLDSEFRDRLISLLNDASNRFDKELDRLRSNEIFDLDVQIDSLKQQLKN